MLSGDLFTTVNLLLAYVMTEKGTVRTVFI